MITLFGGLPFPELGSQDVKTLEIIVSEVCLEGMYLIVK